MSYGNLLSDATVYLIDGTGGWVATENCDLVRLQAASLYETTLGSGQYNAALGVTTTASGTAEFRTEAVKTNPGDNFKFAFWIAALDTNRTFELTARFYDANGNFLQDFDISRTTQQNFWIQLSNQMNSPDNANAVELVIKISGVTPNERFRIAHPAITDSQAWINLFLGETIEHVPDYMLDADNTLNAYPDRQLQRFIDIATRQLANMAETTYNFEYIRAEDEPNQIDYNSYLTDPYLADFTWLGWLAQQVGVRLTVTGSGFTSWQSFASGAIATWDDWETQIVSGGSGPDTIWSAIENFEAGSFESLEAFRDQIWSGFNGVMSSTSDTIRKYIQTLLNSTESDPFIFVRKHYRTNPWRIAVVVNEAENPDPGGTTLADFLSSTAPAGMTYDVLQGVSRSALMLYDAQAFSEQLQRGYLSTFPAGYGVIPTPQIHFIQDELGTGRNIVLMDDGTVDWWNGGGVGPSRYFVDPDGNNGHALYGGYTSATIASDASFDVTGSLDIRLLISDVRHSDTGTDPRLLIESENKWGVYVGDSPANPGSGYLIFQYQNEGNATRTAYLQDVPVNWDRYRPFWIRITHEPFDGSQYNTIFYAADDPLDGWQELDVYNHLTAATSIYSSASNSINVFSNNTSLDDSATGVVHRAIVYDGIEGSSAGSSVIADINFLDAGVTTVGPEDRPNIYPGVSSFTENAQDLTVTIAGASDPGINEYDWVVLGRQKVDGSNEFVDGDAYWHFGAHAGGIQGDQLAVSGLASANRDYVITYVDGTSASANIGTATTFTFDSDDADFGGKGMTSIQIVPAGGGTPVAEFLPTTLTGSTTVNTDAYGATWTLTREFFSGGLASEFYEPSSSIDRDCLMPRMEGGVIRYGGFGYGASVGSFNYDDAAVSATYRRFWDNTENAARANIVSNEITVNGVRYGYRLDILSDNVVASLFDGVRVIYLVWDEVAAGRLGEWNNIILNFDPLGDTVELIANGTVVDSTGSFFANQYLSLPYDQACYASFANSGYTTGPLLATARLAMDSWSGGDDVIQTIACKGEGDWKFGINTNQQSLHFSWDDGGVPTSASVSYAGASFPFVDGEVSQLAVEFDTSNGDVEFFQIFNPLSYTTPDRFGNEDRISIGSVAGGGATSFDNVGSTSTLGVDNFFAAGTASLAASVAATDTSFSIDDATGWPTAPFRLVVEDEIMYVGARSGTSLSSVTRGYDNTLAVDHDVVAVQAAGEWSPLNAKMYRFQITDDPTELTADTVRFDFAEETLWNVNSTTGDDITGNYTATLNGQASIQNEPRVSLLPSSYPIDTKVFDQFDDLQKQTYNLSQLALYDHSLDEIEVAGLVVENNLS